MRTALAALMLVCTACSDAVAGAAASPEDAPAAGANGLIAAGSGSSSTAAGSDAPIPDRVHTPLGNGGSDAASAGSGDDGSAGTPAGGGAGAASSAAGAGAAGSSAAAPVRPAEWFACDADADCVAVPSHGCCGCTDTGVNRRFEVEAAASLLHAATACPPLGCASPGCMSDARAVCVQGSCVATHGCRARTAEACEADDTCRLYAVHVCGTDPVEPPPLCAVPPPSGGCAAAPPCRIDPDNGRMLSFDACPPAGWDVECPSACL